MTVFIMAVLMLPLLAWAAIFAVIIVITVTATPVEHPAGAVSPS
ncbi:MAG: hypothetical protein ACSLE3_08525 [Microbacteriaceae bacterium]